MLTLMGEDGGLGDLIAFQGTTLISAGLVADHFDGSLENDALVFSSAML